MNSSRQTFHIGFDDTDSIDGMCTTFLCYNLAKYLRSKKGVSFLDYPNLIRLNPNIPWKTRGNAALALRISTDLPRRQIYAICKRFVCKYATSPRANAGLVLLEGEEIPAALRDFSEMALYSVLSLREARKIINEQGIDSFSLRSGQGLIGALGAIGNSLPRDHTYELIAYRSDTSISRTLQKDKVVYMSNKMYRETFGSYDPKYDRVMIAPHGPDPVLCGIRGESAEAVQRAFKLIRPIENLCGWMIVRSNQGTGEHLRHDINLDHVKSYVSGKVSGRVTSVPISRTGGHVFFTIENPSGSISCACYEPTGSFRSTALSLIVGDKVEVGGGIRRSTSVHPRVLNLEYIRPIKLERKIKFKNPACPNCFTSTSSMGRGQGFRCDKCGYETYDQRKRQIEEARSLSPMETYIPPTKAHRHLTKPLKREGKKNKVATMPLKLCKTWLK